MDDRKIRSAFDKVKLEIASLKKDVIQIHESNETKNTDDYRLDKLKFENFITNVENELASLNLSLKEIEDRFNHKLDSIKSITSTKDEVVEERFGIVEKKVSDVNDLLKKKIEHEVDMNRSLIEELDNKIASLNKLNDNNDLNERLTAIESNLSDINELSNEKIDLEINSLRMETTEEIAKIYDRVFTELIELKEEVKKVKTKKVENKVVKQEKVKEDNKEVKKTKVDKPLKKESKKKEEKVKEKKEDSKPSDLIEEPKKEGRFKKVMNWLFIDEEEEEEMKNIKSEVKNK